MAIDGATCKGQQAIAPRKSAITVFGELVGRDPHPQQLPFGYRTAACGALDQLTRLARLLGHTTRFLEDSRRLPRRQLRELLVRRELVLDPARARPGCRQPCSRANRENQQAWQP